MGWSEPGVGLATVLVALPQSLEGWDGGMRMVVGGGGETGLSEGSLQQSREEEKERVRTSGMARKM